MRAVTITELITRIRRRSDTENALDRFPDSEVTDELNEGVAALYDEILRARGQPYYRKSFAVTTDGVATLYDLPTDLYQLVSVETIYQGFGYQLDAFTEREHAPLIAPTFMNCGYGYTYQMRGGTAGNPEQIELLPLPVANLPVTVWYVPVAPYLDSVTVTTFDGFGGWEEFAVLYAAVKLMEKDKDLEKVQSLSSALEGVRARIQAMQPKRDRVNPSTVTDVRDRMGDRCNRPGWRYRTW